MRISFLGGGTDLPSYCQRDPGRVLSCTIDKCIFVIVKRRFDARVRVGYTRTELVDTVAELEHDLVREALRVTGIESGVEITTMGDIPSQGSGLGSSSTATVGLLHGLWLYRGRLPSRRDLAEGACEVELHRLGRPAGRQDQYAAAFGGLRHWTFTGNEVHVTEPLSDTATLRALDQSLLLFFTGATRSSSPVLAEQARRTDAQRGTLRAMAELADEGWDALGRGDTTALGKLMHEGWMHKRTLAPGVSSSAIDAMYEAGRGAGAVGGKICGAGGGGFLLLYCPPERHAAVRTALADYQELRFSLDPQGTRVVANLPRAQWWLGSAGEVALPGTE